jgi:UDP-N-acetylmuramate dehydrogenase
VSLSEGLVRELEALLPVRRDEPLSRHTTFGIGGPADAYVAPETGERLAAVVRLCLRTETPFFILGSGSNIVAGDGGIRGVTIENRARAATGPFEVGNGATKHVLRAEAGASFAGLARRLAFAGYAGLEWACGIPGTVGGAVVYNAGAYGGCLGDVLLRVGTVDAEGESVVEAGGLGLVYRGSAFTRGLMAGRAVVWAEFALWPGDEALLRERVRLYDERRLRAQPRGRNAGSVFKNPPERPAWKLIDEAGLRGYRIGGALFSEKHCNFIVNDADASAANVAALIRVAQVRVYETAGVRLEPEVSLVGEGFG